MEAIQNGKMERDIAERCLKDLWARYQFADGYCNLPPKKKGAYPTLEEIEAEFQGRTGRDPKTGKRKEAARRQAKPSTARGAPDKVPLKTHQEAAQGVVETEKWDPRKKYTMTGANNEPDYHKKRSVRKANGVSTRAANTSQALVPINPHSSQLRLGKSIQIWTSSKRQERTFKPGYTSSGEKIVAFGKVKRREISDGGREFERTTRSYVVKNKHKSYSLQPEGACGGPEIWEMLPQALKQSGAIGQNFDSIPNRRRLPHMRHGISWVAIGRCGPSPSRYPPTVCEIFWYDGDVKRKAVIWRTQLQKAWGPENADSHLAKTITPPGEMPPPDFWSAINRYQPNIEPTVRVSQRVLQAAPQWALTAPPTQPSVIKSKDDENLQDTIASLTKELKRLKMAAKNRAENRNVVYRETEDEDEVGGSDTDSDSALEDEDEDGGSDTDSDSAVEDDDVGNDGDVDAEGDLDMSDATDVEKTSEGMEDRIDELINKMQRFK